MTAFLQIPLFLKLGNMHVVYVLAHFFFFTPCYIYINELWIVNKGCKAWNKGSHFSAISFEFKFYIYGLNIKLKWRWYSYFTISEKQITSWNTFHDGNFIASISTIILFQALIYQLILRYFQERNLSDD